MALLDVRDLRLYYDGAHGPVRAVDGVSFSIEKAGETLGIIGESGSGKTSMASALVRTLPPNVTRFEGSLRFGSRDLMALSDEAFRREVRWKQIAVVFQGAMNAFNPVMKIGHQIAERLLLEEEWEKGAALAEARRLIELVGLRAEVADRYPHELSGGMKQRAVIAMALALKPPLLILDEPTSALDVSVQAQVMNLLKRLKWELGITMIFITHDIALASDISDHIAVVKEGTLQEYGPAEDVLTRPEHPYTRQLLAAIPRLHAWSGHDAPPEGARGATGPGGPAASSDPLVTLEGVKVHFPVRRGLWRSGVVKAVGGVDLVIRRGETLALVGESGSGKTTLGRAALGLVKTAGGSVRVAGIDVGGLGRSERRAFRRRAQAIFQDPFASVSPFMSVYEIVEEPLVIHKIGAGTAERRHMVYEALEQVKLTPPAEFAAKYPHNLSGGQRQRVSIARSLVLDPEFIVADEPVSMIDASSRLEVLRLLRELQERRGITFLYITHDIASARRFADRIAVMYLGTLVEIGPSTQVIDEPRHPYTQALIRAVPEPDPANRTRMREVISGEPPSPLNAPVGCPFAPRCPQAIPGRCDAVRPVLKEVAGGHWTACHLYEVGGESAASPAAGDA